MTKGPIDAGKTGLVLVLLQGGFPDDEVQDAFDFSRSAQFYRVASRPGLRHRVFVSKEFFDDHSETEITALLRRWKMLEIMRQAGPRAVIVTNAGISVPGLKTHDKGTT